MSAYKPLRERLLERSIPEPNTGCWLWDGCVVQGGYGRVGGERTRRLMLAHRAAWEAFRGPIPANTQVLHGCDVPACINPAHLFLGTQVDNMRDMRAKGRERYLSGEDHGNALLTGQQVREIRAALSDGRATQVQLAERYGVDQPTISRIKLRKGYRLS